MVSLQPRCGQLLLVQPSRLGPFRASAGGLRGVADRQSSTRLSRTMLLAEYGMASAHRFPQNCSRVRRELWQTRLDNDIDGFKSAPGVGEKVLTAPCRPQERTVKHLFGFTQLFHRMGPSGIVDCRDLHHPHHRRQRDGSAGPRRMPVILPRDACDPWLAGDDVSLAPYAPDAMTAHPVSTLVNRPRQRRAALRRAGLPDLIPRRPAA